MQVGVGYSDIPDSATAGKQAVRTAIKMSGRQDSCDVVVLFTTARHNLSQLRAGAVSEAGSQALVYGGGAVGIITNDIFGYAGYQVGAACFWLDGSDCKVLVDNGLATSEEEAGIRLGKQLTALDTRSDSQMLMFYDAVYRSGDKLRLMMATRLLAGIEKGLGFLPKIMGAGAQGDHVCTPTGQFIGDSIGEHCAMIFKFSDNIHINSTIMHGCRPASPYYTVTKADGPVILEINGKPAIEFMDGILGPDIQPEQYPFFLLFGINYGQQWEEYDEDKYNSRLCLGLDTERGGIVMFEPDMTEGTEFQIMMRSFNFDYMQPKIEALFNKLDGREPIFATYIDCAGRCAGYGGIDLEDAYVVQRAVGSRVPLLGLYTGVEIAPLGGRSRGQDWTGVFCLFSQEKEGKRYAGEKSNSPIWEQKKTSNRTTTPTPIEAVQRLCEQNTAKILALDAQTIAIRYELEQKRRGFSLLSELSVKLRQMKEYDIILEMIVLRINAALNMQKTIVLLLDGNGKFEATILNGYSEKEKATLIGHTINVAPALLNPSKPVLITAENDKNNLAEMRETLYLPYFISSPIIVNGKTEGLLITGRMVEQMPFLSRLCRSDVETVQAISTLLASVFMYQKLDDITRKAHTDALTGLYNRRIFESLVTQSLYEMGNGAQIHALIIVDFDLFKQVNDGYGHLRGDDALKALADTLRRCFRSSDIIARIGGDEFAVFCTNIGEIKYLSDILSRFMEDWRITEHSTGDGATYHATLSLGIAIAPRDGTLYNELFDKADAALYQSKRQGRDQYTIYGAETVEEGQNPD